jgi:hypothetical protein
MASSFQLPNRGSPKICVVEIDLRNYSGRSLPVTIVSKCLCCNDKSDVLIFGDQKGRWVGRVESERGLPFGLRAGEKKGWRACKVPPPPLSPQEWRRRELDELDRLRAEWRGWR